MYTKEKNSISKNTQNSIKVSYLTFYECKIHASNAKISKSITGRNEIYIHSSTIQNILLRYGHNLKLNFVFGKGGSFTQLGDLTTTFNLDYFNNVKNYDMPWHNMLAHKDGYDICAIHMKWNKTAVR